MPDHSGVNKVFLLGTVLFEPRCHVIEHLKNEYIFVMVTKVITQEKYGTVTHLEYHHVRMSAGMLLQNAGVKKGQLVELEGKIQTTCWTASNNVRRYRTEVYVIKLRLIGQMEASEQPVDKLQRY